MSFHFETSPKRVVLYIEKSKDGHVTPIDGVQIVDFACGNNHTVIYIAYYYTGADKRVIRYTCYKLFSFKLHPKKS